MGRREEVRGLRRCAGQDEREATGGHLLYRTRLFSPFSRLQSLRLLWTCAVASQ